MRKRGILVTAAVAAGITVGVGNLERIIRPAPKAIVAVQGEDWKATAEEMAAWSHNVFGSPLPSDIRLVDRLRQGYLVDQQGKPLEFFYGGMEINHAFLEKQATTYFSRGIPARVGKINWLQGAVEPESATLYLANNFLSPLDEGDIAHELLHLVFLDAVGTYPCTVHREKEEAVVHHLTQPFLKAYNNNTPAIVSQQINTQRRNFRRARDSCSACRD